MNLPLSESKNGDPRKKQLVLNQSPECPSSRHTVVSGRQQRCSTSSFILSHRILKRRILKAQDLIKLIFKNRIKIYNVFLHVVNVIFFS